MYDNTLQLRPYLTLTGFYLLRGWLLWAGRQAYAALCCLLLIISIPLVQLDAMNLAATAAPPPPPIDIPVPVPVATQPAPVPSAAAVAVLPPSPAPAIRGYVSWRRPGNTYAYGHCTFYVANRRIVPGNWGHARSWYSGAQRAGYKVGTHPAVGAIAWSPFGYYGHVALVEQVSGSNVLIAEMNYVGWNRVSQRWVPAHFFKYIY